MEESPPQTRGSALVALLFAGCYVLPAPPGARPRSPDYYFLRYDVYPVAAPRGEMKPLLTPPAGTLRPGRTLFVQAGRQAAVRWREVSIHLRPFVDARGMTALESGKGTAAAPPAGGGVLVGLGQVSAFVRVEPLE